MCEGGERELASASDEATNTFLSSTFNASEVWLGGYREDVNNETSWKWTDKKWGFKKWGFTSWAQGEPKKQEAIVTNYGQRGKWDDQNRDSLHSFICQMSKKGLQFAIKIIKSIV